MDLGLAGRVAVVTGSSQGIGRATALLLGSEGARVAVTYHRERDKALAVVDEIEKGGGEAVAAQLGLASTGSVSRAAGTALERWGRVDVLVNNAVYWGDRVPWEAPPLFEELAAEEWRAYFRLNFEGAYSAVQAVLPSMRSRGFGRIVSVSSGVAADGFPGTAPYGAAKAALHGLTKTLSKELAPAGILVNVVMPSLTRTERMVARLPAQALEMSAQASPLRRLPRPDEVAAAIVYLCSAANTAITGEILRVGGGAT
jgi:NAD(P)-dependent dehydrogenase (short-subunit alcohol dehydrogenase family)